MSDLSSQTLQNSGNIAQTSAFADALQRAKQIAAKINPASVATVGQKRPHESAEMDAVDAATWPRAVADLTVEQAPMLVPLSVGPDGKRSAAMADPYGAQLAASMAGGAGVTPPASVPMGIGGMDSEEVMVPDRMVGLIIGRGGESINRLQSESGAKIQMAPACSNDSQERVCSICGSRAAIDRAKELIQSIVQSRAGERDRPGGGGGVLPDMAACGDHPGHTTSEIMVPSGKVGLIIGKGGETIKQLQDKSGSKMVVIQDGAFANAPEKPLRITGDAQQIHEAKQLVFELMADKEGGFRPPGGGMNRGFGPVSTVEVPQAAVGVVIGKGGDMIRKIQSESGCNIQFQQNMAGREERVCTLNGTPDQINMARSIIINLIESVVNRDQGGPGNGFGNGAPRNGNWGGGPYGGPGRAMGRNDKTEVSLPIPAAKCGFVIGKGGETIKAINTQSGAHCELDRRPSANMNEKIFVIKGTGDQVEMAKRLICEKVGIPYCPPGGPGGPFGGPMGGPGGPGGFPPQGWPNSGFPNQGVWGQQNEPGKPDGWNNYYAQFYGGQGGPGQAGGPGGQPGQQPQASPAPNVNPQTGQPDYSAQWIEYYRRMGMNAEADAVERQAKANKVEPGAGAPGAPAGPGGAPPASQPSTNGGQPDYTMQWIEYYRCMGMEAEAEKLEAQVKTNKGPAAAAPGAAGPAAPAAPNDYTDQWIAYYKNHGMMDRVSELEKAKEQQSMAPNPAAVAGGAPAAVAGAGPAGAPAGFQPGFNYSGYGAGGPGGQAPAGFGQYGSYPGAGDN